MGGAVSDYIDGLIAKHMPCEFPDGDLACDEDHAMCCAAHYRELGRRLARAVAAEAEARARVCRPCGGRGYMGLQNSIKCQRCHGRGITFDGGAK